MDKENKKEFINFIMKFLPYLNEDVIGSIYDFLPKYEKTSCEIENNKLIEKIDKELLEEKNKEDLARSNIRFLLERKTLLKFNNEIYYVIMLEDLDPIKDWVYGNDDIYDRIMDGHLENQLDEKLEDMIDTYGIELD